MPRYLIEMDAELMDVFKNSGLLKLVESAADPLRGFKHKAVQGLYHYNHYERPDGSFVQVWQGKPKHFIYQDPAGQRHRFADLEALKAHLAAEHSAKQDDGEIGWWPDMSS